MRRGKWFTVLCILYVGGVEQELQRLEEALTGLERQ